ncbi:hypothetical protein BZG36_02671 [Bifiguratus adelaidae]|uniref:Probable quinone oxidoreductase n=1 Tax=Bifiguratus adelaidae TaxID=1938954 RepID=A0A261Y1J6_9FUNG|nr:hypothetical protein BZG36_02671 [Bifiguratus adelaidae]
MADQETKVDAETRSEVYDDSHFIEKGADNETDTGHDVFGNEEGEQIRYKTLTWPAAAALMIAETVSNGTTALPSVLGTVGLVPGVILIVVLGMFALYTGILLGRFKLRHASVHNMGDAGNVLFGRIGREIFTFGSIVFALASTGGQLLSGQIALNVLDVNVCQLVWLTVFAVATFICAVPRRLEEMSWLSAISFASIVIASLVGMIGGGINKDPARVVQATISGVSFYNAFLSVTNIIFAYAGHFAFFAFISEMKNPKDCVKSIITLQAFSIVFYTVFAVVFYVSFGNSVASPSFSSLPPTLAKVTYGLALPNFLIAGVIYTHVAAKILFLRFFRGTRHVHSNTRLGVTVWLAFCALIVILAWILAEGVPNFSDLLVLTLVAHGHPVRRQASSFPVPTFAPVPTTAMGPPLPAKGYIVQDLGQGLYWLTDEQYQSMFLVSDQGVIVVDAPPTIGHNILYAIGNVTDKPITHFVYSHSHGDHNSAAYLMPKNTVYIANQYTRDILAQVNDPSRPLPTKTFAKDYILRIGNQTLELSYKGPNHEYGNLFIWAPKQKVLMLVDVVFPGWVPFAELAVSQDIPGWVGAHDQILAYPFDVYIGGHLNRPGNRQDVVIQKNYVLDVLNNCAATIEDAMRTFEVVGPVSKANPGNSWAVFKLYLDDFANICANKTNEKWLGKLGGADAFGFENAYKALKTLRLDYGILGPFGLPVPIPKAGKGQVVVKNHAIGINYIDTYQRSGVYKMSLPFILGREGAGEVVEVGEGAGEFKVGDRVAYREGSGSYAEYTAVDIASVGTLAPHITYDQGASVILQGLTAWTMVRSGYEVKAGDWVLVHAAAGGVGLLLCQMCKQLGAHVIGTVSTDEKAAIAKENGAEYVINYSHENVTEKVNEITKGLGCHAVLDGVGKSTWQTSLDCTRRLGTLISFGNASGVVPPISIMALSDKNLKLMRPRLFPYVDTRANFLHWWGELKELLDQGKLKLKIFKTYPLEEVVQAHKDLEGRVSSGKLLLRP